MKKIWKVLTIVLMTSLVLTLTTVPLFAQNNTEQETGLVIRNALGIQAPRVAPVGEQVTINVIQRGTQEPVKDAEVWAIPRENAPALKEELVALREQGVKLADIDLGSIVSGYGFSLGSTNGAGKVMYTFENAGGYQLVATKANYIPGFSRIFIGAEQPYQTR